MSSNPLQKHFRQSKISISLPSNGNFYPNDFLETTITNEIEIKAMRAADEISLKNPDALLNGSAMENLIRSCAPGVKNPRELLLPDYYSILLGIRFASLGDRFNFKAKCPKCNHENNYHDSIRRLLGTCVQTDPDVVVQIEDVKIKLRPHTFETNLKSELIRFEQQKLIQFSMQDSLTEKEKLSYIGTAFDSLKGLTSDLVTDAVEYIELQDQKVSNREHIREYIEELPSEPAELLRDKIQELNTSGVPKSHECVCSECSNTWTEEGVEFDSARFFD